METETISGRNVADQLFRKRFGSNVCGKSVGTKSSAEDAGETVGIVGADGEQIVLQETTELPTPTPDSKAEEAVVGEGFVLGWDCL